MCCSSQCGKRSCHLGLLVVSHKPSLLSTGSVLYATHWFITCWFSQALDYHDVEVPLFKQPIFHLTVVIQYKNSNAGNSGMPEKPQSASLN